MRKRIRRWVVILAPLLLVGSCFWAGCEFIDNMNGDLDDLPDTSITRAEAVGRLDALAHEVIGPLPSHTRLVNRYGLDKDDDEMCVVGLAQKVSGQVKVIVEYHVLDLSPHHFPEYLETFDRYARSKGWSVPEEAPDQKYWFKVDSMFKIGMHAANGKLSVYGSSECIWPDGHRRDPYG